MLKNITILNKFHINYSTLGTNPVPYSMKDLSIPVILTAFVALILSTLRKYKDASFMDFTATEQMRGVAIILIVLSHYITNVFQPTTHYYWIFKDTGGIGVGIFLFLSGYGLTMSFLKKGLEKYYLLKRFIRIFIPYWIFLIPWIFLDSRLLSIHHSFKQILESVLGVVLFANYSREVNPSLWYVMFILIWYIIFFVIFSLKKDLKTKVFLTFLSGAILLLFSHQIVPKTEFAAFLQWGDYAIYFPLGVLMASLKEKVSIAVSKFNLLHYLLLFLILFVFGQYYFFFLAIAFMVPFLYMSKINMKSGFLVFVGSISYELYLVHVVPLIKYDIFLYNKPYLLSFILFFAVMTGIAYVVHVFVERYLSIWVNTLMKRILWGY